MPDPIIGPYPYLPLKCRDYDPRAADVAQSVKQLITSRLPSVTVEHVGSTAVPGCAGKGIVDLIIIYPEGQLEVVKDLLASLGFQRQTVGFLWPEERPMRVGAVTFDGSTFPVHAHVLADTSPEVAKMRAFSQRLQADPDLRAAYVALKQEILARTVTDPAEYTQLKGDFIRGVVADV